MLANLKGVLQNPGIFLGESGKHDRVGQKWVIPLQHPQSIYQKLSKDAILRVRLELWQEIMVSVSTLEYFIL